jgi:two-component sensor histidine kinase
MPVDRKADWKSYVLAVFFVAIAAAIPFAFGMVEERVLLFALFYPTVLLTAVWVGAGPAIFAIVLLLSLAWLAFVPPLYTLEIKDQSTLLNLGLFTLSSGLTVWIANRYRCALNAFEMSEEARELIVEEMRHRSRNSLAASKSIIDRTLLNDPAAAAALLARLQTVLEAENVFKGNTAKGELLQHVVLAELRSYSAERFLIDGPPLMLAPGQAPNFSLIVHELATNAAKFGAFSNSRGFLSVSWLVTDGKLEFKWQENSQSPMSSEPPSRGLGSRLIDAAVKKLKGNIIRSFDGTGFKCRIVMPLDEITRELV